MLHPGAKNLLVGRVRLDLHTADVAHAVGRLVQQQRARRIVAIHERRQREAERVDFFCARRLRPGSAASCPTRLLRRYGTHGSRLSRAPDTRSWQTTEPAPAPRRQASPQHRTRRQGRAHGGSKEQDPPYVRKPGLAFRPGQPRTFVFILCMPRALLSIRPAAPSVRDAFPRKSTVDARCCLKAATPSA